MRIAVKDQGIGMDQKEVRQIFQKFYRTKKAEESGEAGTGIGLSIVQQIVEQHGGRIEVASQPGAGSCFTLVLPAAAGARFGRASRAERQLMEKLLLVEDDPALQFTIQIALEEKGYAVDAVSTTGEAIERLAGNAYPIVISDIYVDERTGLDVLDAAKRKEPALRRDPDDRPRHDGNRHGGHARRRVRLHRQALRPGRDAGRHRARRGGPRRTRKAKAEEEELPETEMIGSLGRPWWRFIRSLSRVAPTDATVVVEGETGTGKDLVARMIHRFSAARQPAVRARGLRRHRAHAARKRAVRRHARRLHRRRPRPRGRVRSRQPRHGVPGRDRRHRAEFPIGAAALSGEPRDSPGGRARARRRWMCA